MELWILFLLAFLIIIILIGLCTWQPNDKKKKRDDTYNSNQIDSTGIDGGSGGGFWDNIFGGGSFGGGGAGSDWGDSGDGGDGGDGGD